MFGHVRDNYIHLRVSWDLQFWLATATTQLYHFDQSGDINASCWRTFIIFEFPKRKEMASPNRNDENTQTKSLMGGISACGYTLIGSTNKGLFILQKNTTQKLLYTSTQYPLLQESFVTFIDSNARPRCLSCQFILSCNEKSKTA